MIVGYSGEDWEYGGAGYDTIDAGNTNSVFAASDVSHTYGGDGDDLITVAFRVFSDIDGGDGTDTLLLTWSLPYGPNGDETILLSDRGSYAMVKTPGGLVSLDSRAALTPCMAGQDRIRL